MGNDTTKTLQCPACAAPVSPRATDARGQLRCRCGTTFSAADAAGETIDLEELSGPRRSAQLPPADEYTVADEEPPAPRIKAAAAPVCQGASRSFAADMAARYPGRRATPAPATEDEADELVSPLKNVYVPLVLLVAGFGLRVGQLVFAQGAHGNHWWGSGAAPLGIGKSILRVLFEMIIASAITAAGAFLSALVLSIDFGPLWRAALKLCSASVVATGVACWIALFDQGAFSIAGLVLALHAMIIIYWITLGYLFSLELQELLLTVAAITLAHSLGIAGLWRG